MKITFTIPDNKVTEFKNAFLQIYPVPMKESNPIMTENKWVKNCIRKLIFSVYEQGKQQKFYEENKPIYDKDIIQEV